MKREEREGEQKPTKKREKLSVFNYHNIFLILRFKECQIIKKNDRLYSAGSPGQPGNTTVQPN